MKKSFKIILGMLFVAVMVMPFMNVYAAEVPTLSMNVNGDFYVGKQQEFSVTTNVPESYKNLMVLGDGNISDPSAIDKLEYYEVKDGNWYEMPADSLFGPPGTGFPLTDGATSKFRVTFNKAGNYTVNISLKDASTQSVVAQNSLQINVVDESVKNVSTEEELLAALNDTKVKTINVTNNFTVNSKVNIVRDVTINGNGKEIKMQMDNNTVWDTNKAYVLQAYHATVVINDIKLTGANAALIVNGANVTLNGTIDVSGNGFGGIEVSGTNPTINLANAKLVNNTEAYLLPTLWTDPVLDNVVVDYPFGANIIANNGKNDQKQFYLLKENSMPNADTQIKDQLSQDKIVVETTSNDTISVDVLNELKNGPEKEVVIKTENATISFNTKNMVDEFTTDLKLKLTVTENDVLGDKISLDENAKALYIVLDYEGVLPKDTKITFDVKNVYNVGDKVYLYYFNEETKKAELIASDIVIDENGLATITLDHASTYFLSLTEVTDENVGGINTGDVENPNTSDITIAVIAVLALAAVAGFAYVAKTKMANK